MKRVLVAVVILILLDLVVSDQRDCVIRQHRHGSFQSLHVLHRGSINRLMSLVARTKP
ncbi:MAG: hypothetical protein ABI779_26585 [Acidobacteriota bacterium]